MSYNTVQSNTIQCATIHSWNSVYSINNSVFIKRYTPIQLCLLQISYLFDNAATVFFAVFVSFWGKNWLCEIMSACCLDLFNCAWWVFKTALYLSPFCSTKTYEVNYVCYTIAVFFLEFWKRKEVTLAYHWDVLEYEEEEVTIIFNFIQVPYVNIQ